MTDKFTQFGTMTGRFSHKKPNFVEVDKYVEEARSDFDEYLDAIIEVRKEALKQRLEERSIKINSIHRGTKE